MVRPPFRALAGAPYARPGAGRAPAPGALVPRCARLRAARRRREAHARRALLQTRGNLDSHGGVPGPAQGRQSSPRSRRRSSSAGASATSSASRMRRREGATPFVFYEGPPTANGRPGLPPRARARVQGHLPPLPDDARALRRAQGGLGLPRAAGRDRRRAAARLHAEVATSSATASPSSTRKCRESVFEFLDDWTRLTERIGYWVDLEHPYRTLDDDLRRVGLVGAGGVVGARTCSTRATRSSPTARATAPRSPRTRSRRATRTSRTPRSTCASR